MKNEYNYYAFISYNNRDEKWAKKIQYQLQHYRLPSLARKEIGEDVKIRPVFRYVTNLGPGDLHENLGRELESSKYLIVICSPNSAQPNIQGKHWVNDEITRFINLGRRDRIIPVIVGGTPNSGDDKECFPPALRNADIAGVDITVGTTKERHHAFLKIVAKLLDLKPEILTRYVEDEDKAIKRRGWWRMAPILALCAIGGLFAWDSTRTVRNYYANYVDSFGLPQGIFQLKQSELAGRGIHYRFEYRGYGWGKSIHADSSGWSPFKWLGFYRVLRRVVQAHSSGSPTEWNHTEYSYRPPIQEFFYEGDWPNVGKRVKKIVYRTKAGAFKKRLELGAGNDGTVNGLLKFYGMEIGDATPLAMESGLTTTVAFEAVNGRRTEITQHAFERDARGNITRVTFMNTYGSEVPDGDGIYGYEYKLDDKGRRVEQWYLGLTVDGKVGRVVNKIGVGGKFYTYRGRNMSEARYVDDTGRPVMGLHGWMVCVDEFDEWDNNTRSTFYDEKGNVTSATGGIAGYTAIYDRYGNQTSLSYFGVDGKPTLHSQGNAGWVAEYDEFGRVKRLVSVGIDGKPTLIYDGWVKLRFAERRMEYNERGHLTRESYFGVDGRPTLHNDRFAERRMEYNEQGYLTRESYSGVDSKPTLHRDGFAELRMEYDERGKLTCKLYFGVDGKPTLHRDGFAELRMEYDERGNRTHESYFGTDGKLTLHKDGFAEVRMECDARGNLTQKSYFGIDGSPTLHKDGYAELRMEYNEHGKRTRESYFGVGGRPTLHKDGYVELRMEYDVWGHQTKELYFGVDGKLTFLRNAEYAGWESEYDERGNTTRHVWLGIDGKPTMWYVASGLGYAEYRSERDKHGRWEKTAYYDADGKLVILTRREYDVYRNETKMSHFGVDGRPTLCKDGYAEYRAEYDIRGNLTKESYFGVDGTPILHKNGYADSIVEYDERGNRSREAYFGVDGKPTLHKDGYAECKESYYGTDGKPILHQLGIAGYIAQYDDYGHRIMESYFGTDGKPIKSSQGFAELRREYDGRGNPTKESYFDENGHLVVGAKGFSVANVEYDDRGNVVKESYYGKGIVLWHRWETYTSSARHCGLHRSIR